MNYAMLLGVATVLCVVGLVQDNLSVFFACMLISPILDIPLDFMNGADGIRPRLATLLVLPVIGVLMGLLDGTITRSGLMDGVGKAYVDGAPWSFVVSAVVAVVCGILLRQTRTSPVIAVAINLATSLLPQCIALGYYAVNAKYTTFDVAACAFVFALNIFGLIAGVSISRHIE